MAIRWTPSGLQSYDPYQAFKTKLTGRAPLKKKEKKPDKITPGTFKDVKTGGISGVETPEGKVYFGVNTDVLASLQKAGKIPADFKPIGAEERERIAAGGLPREELEALQAQGNIEELRGQILDPDLSMREAGTPPAGLGISLAPFGRPVERGGASILEIGGLSFVVSNEQIGINETKRQIKGLMTTRIDENTTVIQAEARILMENIVVRIAKLGGASIIDKRLGNMEQALVNHREGATDIIRLLQSGGYEPEDAMTDVQQMVQDVAIVEKTMQLLSIHAPSVYSEMKGWEYTTRITKIRRGLLNSQQQILNFAEFGTPLPPESGNLALQLNELANK